MILEDRKPKWVFQKADRLGAKYVVMLAPDEHINNCVTVKILSNGEQKIVPYDILLSTLLPQIS